MGIDSMTDVYIPTNKDFGFVRFGSYEAATRAEKRCQGLEVHGTVVELKLSKSEKRGGGLVASPLPPVGKGYGGKGCGGFGKGYGYYDAWGPPPPAPCAGGSASRGGKSSS